MTTTVTLSALALTDMERSIVENAEILAAAILVELKADRSVIVSLAGLRGAPTSYFNLILRRLVDEVGEAAMRTRVAFEFDSPVQRLVYERSLAAITRAA